MAPVGATAPRVAAAAAARSVRKQTPETRFQLASVSDTALPLAYAPTDAVKDSAVTGSGLKGLRPKDSNPLADVDARHTAIYDITSHTVYLPNGRRLEAHSGLGSHMDDPGYAHARMTGPTPPNVYELTLRESLFHGVRAIRLVPTDDTKMHGRSGILAHSYLLGPSGQSNGCVSFSDYPAFLDSYFAGRRQTSRGGRAARRRCPEERVGLVLQHAQGYFPAILSSAVKQRGHQDSQLPRLGSNNATKMSANALGAGVRSRHAYDPVAKENANLRSRNEERSEQR